MAEEVDLTEQPTEELRRALIRAETQVRNIGATAPEDRTPQQNRGLLASEQRRDAIQALLDGRDAEAAAERGAGAAAGEEEEADAGPGIRLSEEDEADLRVLLEAVERGEVIAEADRAAITRMFDESPESAARIRDEVEAAGREAPPGPGRPRDDPERPALPEVDIREPTREAIKAAMARAWGESLGARQLGELMKTVMGEVGPGAPDAMIAADTMANVRATINSIALDPARVLEAAAGFGAEDKPPPEADPGAPMDELAQAIARETVPVSGIRVATKKRRATQMKVLGEALGDTPPQAAALFRAQALQIMGGVVKGNMTADQRASMTGFLIDLRRGRRGTVDSMAGRPDPEFVDAAPPARPEPEERKEEKEEPGPEPEPPAGPPVPPAGPPAPEAPAAPVAPLPADVPLVVPMGPTALLGKDVGTVMKDVERLVGEIGIGAPRPEVLEQIERVSSGGKLSVKEAEDVWRVIKQWSDDLGGAPPGDISVRLGISVPAVGQSPPHIRNIVGAAPGVPAAPSAYWDTVESSPTLAAEFSQAFNRLRTGTPARLDPARALLPQLVQFRDDGLLNEVNVLSALNETARILDRLGQGRARGMSDRAIVRGVQRHQAELENPEFILDMVLAGGLRVSNASLAELQDLAQSWEDDVRTTLADTMSGPAISALERGIVTDEARRVLQPENMDEVLDFYQGWGVWLSDLSSQQQDQIKSTMDHHSTETMRHIESLIKRERARPGGLSAQITGVLQQMEESMEQGVLGPEEVLHVMEHIQKASHDAGRVLIPNLGTSRGFHASRARMSRQGLDDKEFARLQRKVAVGTAGKDDRRVMTSMVRQMESGLRADSRSTGRDRTAISSLLRGIDDAEASTSHEDLDSILTRSVTGTGHMDVDRLNAAGRERSVAGRKRLVRRELKGALRQMVKYGDKLVVDPTASAPGPSMSERQKGVFHHGHVSDKPVEIDVKGRVMRHDAGVLEFHPANSSDVKSAIKKMGGDSGQLYEVIASLGKLKPVEPGDMVPGKLYVFIPSKGGGFMPTPHLIAGTKLHATKPVGGGFSEAMGVLDKLPAGSAGTERQMVHKMIPRSGTGAMGGSMEKAAWALNDKVAQFPHIKGMRDKSLNQHHSSVNFTPGNIQYRPLPNRMAERLGGGFFDDVGDALKSGAKTVGKVVKKGAKTVAKGAKELQSASEKILLAPAKAVGQFAENTYSDLKDGFSGDFSGFGKALLRVVQAPNVLVLDTLANTGISQFADLNTQTLLPGIKDKAEETGLRAIGALETAGRGIAESGVEKFFEDPSLKTLGQSAKGLVKATGATIKGVGGVAGAAAQFLTEAPLIRQELQAASAFVPGVAPALAGLQAVASLESGDPLTIALSAGKLLPGAAGKAAGIAQSAIGFVDPGLLSQSPQFSGRNFAQEALDLSSGVPLAGKGALGLAAEGLSRLGGTTGQIGSFGKVAVSGARNVLDRISGRGTGGSFSGHGLEQRPGSVVGRHMRAPNLLHNASMKIIGGHHPMVQSIRVR